MPTEENLNLCQPFDYEEIKEVVFQLPKGKAPGVDGFTAEFFQSFWPTVAADLVEALNHF